MNYGYGKTFHLKDGFTALNGCVQYYKVTFDAVDLTAAAPADPKNPTLAEVKDIMQAQANYLRALEVLRTYGGQPIITKVEGKVLEFTLEQPNVYGHNEPQQVSAKWGENQDPAVTEKFHYEADAKAKIEELFANVKSVALAVNTADGYKTTDKADGVELAKAIVEDKTPANIKSFKTASVDIKEVLF